MDPTADKRMVCKYGVRCYQKNPDHHKKYKHPPKRRADTKDDSDVAQQTTKKLKIDDEVHVPVQTADKVNHNVSDSDKSDTEEQQQPSTAQTKEADSSLPKPVIYITPSTFDVRAFIKEKFLVEMPEDFYQLWEFCKNLNNKSPELAFKSIGITLVGPYDVLAGKFFNVPIKDDDDFLVHWRFYYDPPEFQTIFIGEGNKLFHAGYFRDDPKSLPSFVASNNAGVDGTISTMSDNVFGALYLYLDDYKKVCDPFKKITVVKLQNQIKDEATKLKLDLSKRTSKIRSRENKVVARSFNGAGIVVPYNRKTQLGYRELAMDDKELKKLLTKIKESKANEIDKYLTELQPVITYASIALDECDFGTGILLGWNFLYYGIDSLNKTIGSFLANTYSLLQRNEFGKIAQAHMKNRKKGNNLSIV